ncbi:helicase-related protein [Weissella kandleri]|uniref:helicase-related protein n=1 Tax=Weissella kandleri TaxID=1616 RepID=UPI00387EB4D7
MQIKNINLMVGRKTYVNAEQLGTLCLGLMPFIEYRYRVSPAIIQGVCQRCYAKIDERRYSIVQQQLIIYCWRCTAMGPTIKSNGYIIYVQKIAPPEPRVIDFNWAGMLTEKQAKVSKQQVRAWQQRRGHLMYAVTGAGKTETLLPLLKAALENGQKIALVAPRRDVVVELSQRLTLIFSEMITSLYGGNTEYIARPLVICTIHQLMNFHQYFDLIIIDEVDAFPYAGNRTLKKVLQESLKKDGIMHYLSATPPEYLRWLVMVGKIEQSFLALRYHGHQLPMLKFRRVSDWRKKLPAWFLELLRGVVQRGRQWLVFVPTIQDVAVISSQLLDVGDFVGLSSQSADRNRQVQRFREGELQGLVTTTILERGVTFGALDVFILGSDESIYNKANLIQIAGRVGRCKETPGGLVIALGKEYTLKVLLAQLEIQRLNWIGKKG